MKKIDYQLGVGDIEVNEKAKEYILDILNTRRVTHGGVYSKRFEHEFAKLHSCKFAVMLNSGTSALRLALATLAEHHHWNQGDEVIVPAVTFVSTANVIIQNGFKPVFADVESDFYGIDPLKIEEKITSRTKAILPVHLFGMPCNMDPIMAIAKKHNLKVVEDSCETVAANYKNRPAGSFGDISCFSTYSAHIIATGIGGLALTNNHEYAVTLRSLANHGRDSIYINMDDDKTDDKEKLFEIVAKRFRFIRLGYSFRATEFEAALGLAQLENIALILEKRRKNAAWLTEHLKKFTALQLPSIRNHAEHSFMVYPIVVNGINKRDLVNFLEEHNIETRDMLPLINQPLYIKLFGNIEEKYPIAKMINQNGFYIGCHQNLKPEELQYIAKVFEEFFTK